jgi:hypothetical protein
MINTNALLGMKRDDYTKVVDFLLSERMPGELIAQRDEALFAQVMQVIHDDIPPSMAITDPVLYRQLRNRITELRIAGY